LSGSAVGPNRRPRFDAAQQVLERAIVERAFPAAVIEIGTSGEPLLRRAFGRLTFDTTAAAATDDTLTWMLTAGILLRTRPMNPSLDPTSIDDKMSKPVFTIQTVDYESDVFVLKQIE